MAANLHVRNVDDEIIASMKRRAAENGRSAEAEHRAALEKEFSPISKAEWFERADRLRAAIFERNRGILTPGSELLIREDRDSR